MDKVQIILYGVATYLALKSLVSLMNDYRRQYKKKLAQELMAMPHPSTSPSSGPAPTAGKPEPPARKAG